MSTNLESLMAALTKELNTLNTSFVKLDSTLTSEIQGLRKDYEELRELVTNLTAVQSSHSERLTVSEARVYELQNIQQDISDLRANQRALEVQLTAMAPIRVPWTAITLSLIHISEPTRHFKRSRMPSSA